MLLQSQSIFRWVTEVHDFVNRCPFITLLVIFLLHSAVEWLVPTYTHPRLKGAFFSKSFIWYWLYFLRHIQNVWRKISDIICPDWISGLWFLSLRACIINLELNVLSEAVQNVATSREMPCRLSRPNAHFRVRKSRYWALSSARCIPSTHLTLILLPSVCSPTKWSLSSRFSDITLHVF